MLTVTDFKKTYANITSLNLVVEKGALFALLGPNGAGKSTTIKAILDLVDKDAGDIQRPELKRVGYLPENPAFYEYLTAQEILEFYASLLQIKKPQDRITALLSEVGLTHAANQRLATFSKGMIQRIGIAQSLLNDPDFIILDEPLSGLDPIGRQQVKEIILKEKEKGKTFLICSHILSDMQDICTHGAIMNKGEIITQGTMTQLIAQHSNLQEAFMSHIPR